MSEKIMCVFKYMPGADVCDRNCPTPENKCLDFYPRLCRFDDKGNMISFKI